MPNHQAARRRAPDGPGDAAGPHGSPAPLSTVGIGALCEALNTSRSEILRRIGRREMPEGIRTSGGEVGPGHRRWKLAAAIRIVEKAGRTVPRAWLEAGAK